MVVMSSELYDKFARINRIDQVIFESEQEIANGAEAVDAEIVLQNWRKNILDKLSPENAKGQDARIKKAILSLDTFPQSHQERRQICRKRL